MGEPTEEQKNTAAVIVGVFAITFLIFFFVYWIINIVISWRLLDMVNNLPK